MKNNKFENSVYVDWYKTISKCRKLYFKVDVGFFFFRYFTQVNTREKRNIVSGLLYVPKSRAEYYKRFILEYQQVCFLIKCQIMLLT